MRHHFIPSAYSGAEEAQIAADTARVAGATAGGVVSGAAGAGAVTGLLTAAGVSATVPVVGWVVGGVLAAAGGTVALAMALKDGKVRKDQAIEMAKKLGFGRQAEAVPAFTVAALQWSKSKRAKELARLRKVYAGMKGKKGVFPKLYAADREKIRMKIRVLNAILKSESPKSKLTVDERKGIEAAARSPKIAPAVAEMTPAQMSAATASTASTEGTEGTAFAGIPVWGWAVGAGVLGVIVIAATRSKRSGSAGTYRRVR